MRIAIIADLHANLVALEAALADIAALGADRIVCLGDVAATGPQPREVVERLRALGCATVMGNADAWLLDPPDDDPLEPDARRFAEIDRWCAAQLASDDLAFLRSFEPTVELELGDNGALLCFHGSPRSYDEIILATTPDEELEAMLEGRHAAVLAGGHTHAQMLRRFGEMLLINPGSVGLPYEHNPATGQSRNPPWAEYAVVEATAGRLRVELRRTPVDAQAIVRAALASGMPHAEWWAQDW